MQQAMPIVRAQAAVGAVLLCGSVAAATANLVRNGSFEEVDAERPAYAKHWTMLHPDYQPLEFASEGYEGAAAAELKGDAVTRRWRQEVLDPPFTSFDLSAYVKAENVHFRAGDYASIYAHIIYKDQPYSTATHFYWKIRPGTYDWLKVSAQGMANPKFGIEHILITVGGKFSAGRILVDQVALRQDLDHTPEALLRGKIEDLQEQLKRVGAVDDSVPAALAHLQAAVKALSGPAGDQASARGAWVRAAEALSHEAWAAMFPEAMTGKTTEAQMLYHGVGRTRQDCDRYLATLKKAGCNGVLLSLGSWTQVIYHSDVLPVGDGWGEFDALTYVIEQAHRDGITVLGYLATFHGTHDPKKLPGNFASDHPEWLATGPDRNMPTFPDPANPEVVDTMVRAFVELATRYELDGIGLDYIRYPTPVSLNHDERNRRAILTRYGIDIFDGNPYEHPERWAKIIKYRADVIDRAIRTIHDAVRAASPGTRLIASLGSDPDYARSGFGQDWARSSRWLDYATPMNYDDVSANELLIAKQRDICARTRTVFIPAIGGMPPVHRSWTISTWAKRVAVQRRVGCDGIIIYRIGDLDPAVAAFFGKGPFHSKAAFPQPLNDPRGQVALEKPFGMDLDSSGDLLVAEIDGDCVTVLGPDLKLKRRITDIEGYGRLLRPFDVKVWQDRYYVLDTGHSNVVVADGDWRMLYKIGGDAAGSGPGEFSEPHCLAIAPDGTLFVSDTLNHRIQRFAADGAVLGSINSVAVGGEFPIDVPTGIVVLPNGNLVVAEYGDHPPVIADQAGNILRRLERFGMAYCAYSAGDRIAIAWTYSNRVSVYSIDGELLFTLGSSRDSDAPGQFNKPGGVVIAPDGHIFVNEWRNRRVQKFASDGAFVASSSGPRLRAPFRDFMKLDRTDPTRPVTLAAFTGVLSPDRVRRYHDAGIRKLYLQPGEDIFSAGLKTAVETAHDLGMKADMVFDTYQYGARESQAYQTPNRRSRFATEHPEFFTRKRDGTTANRGMLSYVYPDVRRWKIQQLLRALQQCGADGVVLDYIRWPAGNTDGYDPPAVKRFEQTHGVSPFEVEPTDERWARLRAGYITMFLTELREETDKLPRDITIGVYVDAKPDEELRSVGRDWPTWAQRGLIDALHHMLYTDDFAALHRGVRTGRTRGTDRTRLVSCIDVYCGYLHTPELLRRGAWVSLLAGADEVVVVRSGAIERLQMFDAMKQISEDFQNEAAGKPVSLRGGPGGRD